MRFPGSPLKFFEYLAAGLPVLVTEDSHLGPLMREHGLGAMVSSCDPVEISRLLIQMMRDPELRAKGIRNRELSETLFSWDWVAIRVADIAAGGRERAFGVEMEE
jgi:glycosyltransferase involved in cell wall biosynthesis